MFKSIHEVAPSHRHLAGYPLSLDQVNEIDEAANNSSETFPVAIHQAREFFKRNHEVLKGMWVKRGGNQ